MNDSCRTGTRIFKKSTPNNKLTIYLGKRDFIDHLSHVDPIEGVVLLDPEYVKGRKVFIHLLGAFRYCREEIDLFGLNCLRDLYLYTQQVYPPTSLDPSKGHGFWLSQQAITSIGSGARISPPPLAPVSRLQERLIRKLGNNAYPFCFQLPVYSAASVSLLLNPSENRKPCRIDYELKAYVGDVADDKPQRRSSVRMIIRKLTYAPREPGPQPSTEVTRTFMMSLGSLRAEVSLDKQKYYHGETLVVYVLVDNNSNRTVKRIKIFIKQYTRVCLHSTMNYKCTVAELQSELGFPIHPSQTGWCKVFRLCPLLAGNRNKVGVAMDGDLKHEDTNLASSTIDPCTPAESPPAGIHVQYKVKVRLILGFGMSDVCLQLPFILTHSNPDGPQPGDTSDTDTGLPVSIGAKSQPRDVTEAASRGSSPSVTGLDPGGIVSNTNNCVDSVDGHPVTNGRQTAGFVSVGPLGQRNPFSILHAPSASNGTGPTANIRDCGSQKGSGQPQDGKARENEKHLVPWSPVHQQTNETETPPIDEADLIFEDFARMRAANTQGQDKNNKLISASAND